MAPTTTTYSRYDAPTIVKPLGDNHSHTVIFLHGREDLGEDLAEDFFLSKSANGSTLSDLFPSIKWIFPTAKPRYCARRAHEFESTVFKNALQEFTIISQWFDIWNVKSPNERQKLMLDGLKESIVHIHELICIESKTIPPERIILGGISQGCATAILALLASGVNLCAFIGMSSWLPFHDIVLDFPISSLGHKDELAQQTRAIFNAPDNTPNTEQNMPVELDAPDLESGGSRNHEAEDLEEKLDNLFLIRESKITTPVFLSHSRNDETVPYSQGKRLRDAIQLVGFEVQWKAYEDGGHWIHPTKGVDDIASFLKGAMEV